MVRSIEVLIMLSSRSLASSAFSSGIGTNSIGPHPESLSRRVCTIFFHLVFYEPLQVGLGNLFQRLRERKHLCALLRICCEIGGKLAFPLAAPTGVEPVCQ